MERSIAQHALSNVFSISSCSSAGIDKTERVPMMSVKQLTTGTTASKARAQLLADQSKENSKNTQARQDKRKFPHNVFSASKVPTGTIASIMHQQWLATPFQVPGYELPHDALPPVKAPPQAPLNAATKGSLQAGGRHIAMEDANLILKNMQMLKQDCTHILHAEHAEHADMLRSPLPGLAHASTKGGNYNPRRVASAAMHADIEKLRANIKRDLLRLCGAPLPLASPESSTPSQSCYPAKADSAATTPSKLPGLPAVTINLKNNFYINEILSASQLPIRNEANPKSHAQLLPLASPSVPQLLRPQQLSRTPPLM